MGGPPLGGNSRDFDFQYKINDFYTKYQYPYVAFLSQILHHFGILIQAVYTRMCNRRGNRNFNGVRLFTETVSKPTTPRGDKRDIDGAETQHADADKWQRNSQTHTKFSFVASLDSILCPFY